MKNHVTFLLFVLMSVTGFSQGCHVYKYSGDSIRYESCLKCEEAGRFYQFKKEFQTILDEAIVIDPGNNLPYKEKSVAYLKSGDFISWKYWIDKAVECDEKKVLGYRASCRYQFFRDYKGCIEDIERLDSLVDYDMGEIHNGDYHLLVIKAISYDALGETEKAIEIMKKHMLPDDFYALLYDYFLLGIFELKQGNYTEAVKHFKKQKEVSDIAENEYFLAKTYTLMGNEDEAKKWIESAKEKYLSQNHMFDAYTEPYGRVYLDDIDALLEALATH